MTRPAPAWETTYAHDRRKHRHRCQCCRRILEAGEPVVMARVDSRTSRTIHVECAETPFAGPFTWRDALTVWGTTYLRACGYKLPTLPLETYKEPAK